MAGFRFMMLKKKNLFEKQAKIILVGNCLQKSKHLNECKLGIRLQHFGLSSKSYLHHSQIPDYPAVEQLPLPTNIKDLAYSEKLKFSPQRSRDISGSFISSSAYLPSEDVKPEIKLPVDDRVECYDCSGTINLSSVMQNNVPFPFVSRGNPIYLNMSGGQWGQKEKYMSEDLNNAHHRNSKEFQFSTGGSFTLSRKRATANSYTIFCPTVSFMFNNSISSIFSNHVNQFRGYSTEGNKVDSIEKSGEKIPSTNVPQLSRKEKLKAAVKDYGAVVIVFHVAISLVSLGCCYAVIASGIDLSSVFKNFGADEGAATAGNAANFIIAYGVHKSLAPGRIAITLTAVPFIVKKLRKIGFLKAPQPKPQ